MPSTGSAAPDAVSSTSSQPISGVLAGRTERAGSPSEHLRAEADAEDRDPRGEHVAQELLLVREPGEAVVLVRMHGAAEDHDRVVARRRSGEPPSGTSQRSSVCPAASTASSKTPPGTLGPWVTERTRTGGDSSDPLWTRQHAFCTPPVPGTGM